MFTSGIKRDTLQLYKEVLSILEKSENNDVEEKHDETTREQAYTTSLPPRMARKNVSKKISNKKLLTLSNVVIINFTMVYRWLDSGVFCEFTGLIKTNRY